MQIINKPIEVTDEEVDRALMAEFTASMSNEKATEGARVNQARMEARGNVGKTHPTLGKCVANIPAREYFRLIKKYGHAEVHSPNFLKYFQRKFSDLSPNKI
jgi:phage gpG-like protein